MPYKTATYVLAALTTLSPMSEFSAPSYEARTFSWNAEAGVKNWEVVVQGVDRTFSLTANVTSPIWKWTPTRAGHYIVRVKACNEVGCSEYSAVNWRLHIYPR